jgi:hypothetical protein
MSSFRAFLMIASTVEENTDDRIWGILISVRLFKFFHLVNIIPD